MEVSYQTGRCKSCLKKHFLHLESANNGHFADEWAGPFSVTETGLLVTVVLMFIISSRVMINYIEQGTIKSKI